MKKEKQIVFKIENDLFELFKKYCEKNWITMSNKLREHIINDIKNDKNNKI
jgi:UDP-galactopyranose mutase